MTPDNSPLEAPHSGHDPAAATLSTESLAALGDQMGLSLDASQCTRLLQYAQLLRRWNRVHNLTAIDSDAALLTHHLLDCLAIVAPLRAALARHRPDHDPSVPLHFLDAGSGGGLPGIPLAIAQGHWQALLVDAVQKKCAFLQQAQLELGLANVQVRHARLETANLGRHGLIVSRAFARLRDFVTLTRRHLADDGLWVAMKGRAPTDELAELPLHVQALDTITLHVPHLPEQRHLIVLRPRPGAGAAGNAAPAARR